MAAGPSDVVVFHATSCRFNEWCGRLREIGAWCAPPIRNGPLYRWLPDWESHHFYLQLVEGTGWLLEGAASDSKQADGALVYNLKPAIERRTVAGRVEPLKGVDAGGFFVQARSFQGEQEHHSDLLFTFADERGAFAVDVLPGATYCAFVDDQKWVGEMIDLVPYEPATDRASAIVLPIVAGEEVRFSVTRGTQTLPYQGVSILVRENHSYSWWEKGEQRLGTGSRDRWLTTNESGHALTHVMPGEVEVSVFQPLWRVEEKIRVQEGEPTQVTLHREREAPTAVDAEETWRHAFADADATDRKVWARISGRYCGPCFQLTRWIDDQHGLLSKDYVFLKIDRDQDKHGATVAERVTRGGTHGVPFFAMFASNGELVEESVGPLGNIGFPSSFEEKSRLREMLLATRKRLTDEEIDQLIESL